MSQPPKILVLSITRLGDIVQSIPFFRRLRLRHPQSEIHVLVEACFADVMHLVPEVDRVHTVRLEDLIPNLASGRPHNLGEATSFYRRLVADLQAENYGEVWNLTHTRPSMVLNFLLAGEQGRGVTLDAYGLQRVNSPWLTYFFATNLARPWCQFNLVDIYANCVSGVDWQAGRDLSFRADAVPQRDTIPRRTRARIALHAGASQKSKQWPVEAFRAVAERLARHSIVEVVLIGGRRDADMAAAFRGLPRVVNAIGQTSVPGLASLLSSCDLLISNDSGPMHVAAAVKTPVIALTIGSALGSETAPYGEGHLVIEPDSPCFPCSPQHPCTDTACASRVSADAVAALAEWHLGRRSAPPPDDLAGARVYRTGFSPHDGCLELARQFSARPFERDELHKLMRPAWLSVLEERPLEVPPGEAHDSADLAARALAAEPVARELRGTARQLEHAAAHASGKLRTIENLGTLMRRREEELARILGGHGLLKSLLAYVTVARASLTADDLGAQAQETAAIYDRLIRLLQPLFQASKTTSSDKATVTSLTEDTHEDLSQRT
jgi:ADP-heptose:LPS heptosyltransferase